MADENYIRYTLEVFADGEDKKEGYWRRELYVDARDLQTEAKEEGEEDLTEEEYKELVTQRAKEKLAEVPMVYEFDGEVRNDANTMFIYGRDYNMADAVTIYDEDLGIQANANVTEVTVSQDQNGYSVVPSFGFTQPTLLQKLKKKGVI